MVGASPNAPFDRDGPLSQTSEVSKTSEVSGAEMRCPVCRAAQPWSDACRRCKCDLGLLRSAMAALEHHRLQCLSNLRQARWPEALHHARQAHDLCPNEDTTRLLAVCHLLCEDWPSAIATAGSAAR
jgi:hypothetical protein